MAPPKPIQGIWNLPSIPEPTKGRALHLLRNKKPTDSPRPAKANHGASERPKGEKIGRSNHAHASSLRYTLAVERGRMNTLEHNSHFALAAKHALSDPHALTPLVLLMGFLGASLRYALEMALPAQGGFPAATLIVNIFGCFTLEIINQYVGRRTQLPTPLVKSMGVGLVGAFYHHFRVLDRMPRIFASRALRDFRSIHGRDHRDNVHCGTRRAPRVACARSASRP